MSPISFLVNLRCPHCKQVQPYSQLFRTNDIYSIGAISGFFGGLGRPLKFLPCRRCESKLRIENYSKPKRLALFLATFFGGFICASSIPDLIPEFEGFGATYTPYIQFLVTGAIALVAAIWLGSRMLKVEISE